MTDHSRFDKRVRDLADAVLKEREGALSGAGLRTTVEIMRWSDGGRETSELRVEFWRQAAFVDVIEDFIVRDGQPVASLGEFREWLEHLVDVILEENHGS